MTFVARVCPEYSDVMANLARNDIQESLKDLGPNSIVHGRAADRSRHRGASRSRTAQPLPAWQLTLGTGIESRAVSGPWGSLSIVTGPFSTPILTRDETSLLNDQGQPTGKQIAGATTITLNDDEAALASTHASLWVQGGTPTDPILDRPYPGQYGFAALRCAVDNLNGDNVEWIAYPTGASHVFCYAYYIKPPPTSGTIIVRKAVSAPDGATETFPFSGNITFIADHHFELQVDNGAPASKTFVRAATEAGDAPWNFTELVPPGWSLTSITCTSTTGKSTTTTDLGEAETTVTLAAGDTVTCTYTNTQIPPKGSLRITKTTTGGTGTFRYTVTPAGSQNGSAIQRDRDDDEARCRGRRQARDDPTRTRLVHDRGVAARSPTEGSGRSQASPATATSFRRRAPSPSRSPPAPESPADSRTGSPRPGRSASRRRRGAARERPVS